MLLSDAIAFRIQFCGVQLRQAAPAQTFVDSANIRKQGSKGKHVCCLKRKDATHQLRVSEWLLSYELRETNYQHRGSLERRIIIVSLSCSCCCILLLCSSLSARAVTEARLHLLSKENIELAQLFVIESFCSLPA